MNVPLLTRREADTILRDYVIAAMGHDAALASRTLTARNVRHLVGIVGELTDPDAPAMQGSIGVHSIEIMPMGQLLVIFHNPDPPEGLPHDYGILFQMFPMQIARQATLLDLPEYHYDPRRRTDPRHRS